MRQFKKGILVLLTLLLSFGLVFTTNQANAATKPAPKKNLIVHYLDVGQGDSTLIITPSGETILIDAGNKGTGDEVVAYLKKLKISKIDVLISTHPDADHIGGLDEVIKAFPIGNIYAPKVSHTTQAYKDFLTAVKSKKYTIKTAKAGVTLPVKGVKASFIAPVKDYQKNDLNNWSAVLHVNHGKTNFLFTGDAEELSEKDMIASKKLPKVDVLKVGHHGSKGSTSKAFLNATKPKYSIISVGAKNAYKHPTMETLNRLKAAKSTVYRTDQKGTITVASNGNTISIKTERR